ncbi:hypothetical protein F5141DRAFT_1212225 [Pisolithus sp. B1]|nr:hypothetical protein F5141DRAFT_1212225 [Pisolithus sp. B1]
MSPVSVCNIPEGSRKLARRRNGNNLVLIVARRCESLRIEGVYMRPLGGRLGGAAVWLYEGFSAVSRHSVSILDAPLPPVCVGNAPESLRGVGEELMQPHENADYTFTLIIHDPPTGCINRLEESLRS